MRVLADIATGLRIVVAAFVVYAGIAYGREAFGAVMLTILLGWILDTADGHLARAAANPEPSWLGRNERYIDIILVVAGCLYLVLIGFVPAWALAGYLLLAALLLARFRSIALLTVLEGPLMLLLPVAAFALEPFWGWVMVIAGLIGVLLDWRRLRIRIGILWQDVQRMRGQAEYENGPLPLSDQGKDCP